jgi:hypothetical protein
MIRIDDPALYAGSLEALTRFRPQGYQGRLVQIFLASRYLGGEIPPIGSGSTIESGSLQAKLDTFYRKQSREDAEGSIAIIFSNNHLVPTGQIGRGLRSAANIWRNNLGLQKALVCYATGVELSDPAFLAQPRIDCPHLRPQVAGQLADARCGLHLAASYRREDGPKGLRRDPIDESLAIVDPKRIDHWSTILAPAGSRVPILPLIVALYHDSAISGGRRELDIVDFRRDFGFTPTEFRTYFESDPASPLNRALAGRFPQLQLTWTLEPGPALGALHPVPDAHGQRGRRGRRELLDPDGLPALAASTQPPVGTHWWSAEQAVESYLRDSGWEVINRTRQHVGFDLEIGRPRQSRRFYVEVKSSSGPCNPTLTRSEFEAARRYGRNYILAIAENFAPDRDVSILWVENPASLGLTRRMVEQYPVPRSVWLRNARPTVGRD